MIPENAIEQIETSWDSGGKKSAYYYDRGEKVGYLYWDEDGQLAMEYGIENDQMHGSFQTWHDNGRLEHDTAYIEGKEHGISTQFDRDGHAIGTYEMIHGTGIDLWYSDRNILAEERHYKDGHRDGYERWWCGDNQTIYLESHFKAGIAYGIFRSWNAAGRLQRGFPAYFVDGEKVTKRSYLKACDRDESLPKYLANEDFPQRIMSIGKKS
jgi:antitoxin component YwqK of YwqJK toxin-antitoxin module